MKRNYDTVEEFWDDRDLESEVSSLSTFSQALRNYFQVKGDAHFFHRAGEGLRQLLVRNVSPEKTVLVTAMNCPIVEKSIRDAGLKVEYFDFNSPYGFIDWEKISSSLTSSHGVILIPHFYGVPQDFRPILDKARSMKILVVEDCAHTLGGKIGSSMAGSIGDAALISFNYDKPISLGGGGAVILNNPSLFLEGSALLSEEAERKELARARNWLRWRRWTIDKKFGWKAQGTRILRAFGMGLGLSERFPEAAGFGHFRGNLGIRMLEKYPVMVSARNSNAMRISAASKGRSWFIAPDVRPAWLRQKVLMPNKQAANIFSKRLSQKGIRAGVYNWPKILSDNAHLFPHSSAMATCSVDIPVHQNLSEEAINIILNEMDSVL